MTLTGGLTGFGTHLPDGSKLVKCSRMFSLQFLQENGRISWIFISTLQLKAFYQSVKCLVCLYMHGRSLSCVQLFGTLWTIAHQALLSAGFPRQEYWSGFKKKIMLEWVALPFFRGSSQPRDQTHILLHLLNCRQILYCGTTLKFVQVCHLGIRSGVLLNFLRSQIHNSIEMSDCQSEA